MRDNRINYIAVGAFVLLMLGSLLAVLVVMTGRTGATDRYFTVYDNVGGIQYGTQVLYEGYPIGQVAQVEPLRDNGGTRFRIALEIQEGWPIPVDSRALLAASGLLSAVTIDIRGGDADVFIPPGEIIPGSAGGSMFQALSDIAGEVQELSRTGIRPLLGTLNEYAQALQETVIVDTPEIVADLRAVTETLAVMTPEIANNLADFSVKLDERVLAEDNLESIEQTLDNMEFTTTQFAELATDLQTMSTEVRELLAAFSEIVENNRGDISSAAENLRYTLDTVAQNIDSITYNLEASSRNMLEFSRTIRQNPGLLIRSRPLEDEAVR